MLRFEAMRWRPTIKWRLMVTTLPIVAVVVALKVFLEQGLNYWGSVDFSDISAVLTAVAFLIGFMLAGTMADYKEAEKIPGEIACALEAIEETVVLVARRHGLDVAALRQTLFASTTVISDYVARKRTIAEAQVALAGLAPLAEEVDRVGAMPLAMRVQSEISSLRRSVTRIETIMGTGFLAPGYALLEVMVVATVALLMVSKFKAILSEYVLVTFITLVYVYMLRLIRDIDNPFELDALGAAEVDPAPLVAYRERAEARLAAETPAKIARA